MRKERTLFIIGLLTILLPFSGFPPSWKTVLFVIFGLSIVYLSYLFRIQFKNNVSKENDFSSDKPFVDNINNNSQTGDGI